MEAVFFAIVALVAVARALFRFARWVSRSLSGAGTPAGTPFPPRPMAPQPPAPAQASGAATPRLAQQPPAPRAAPLPLVIPPAAEGTRPQARDAAPFGTDATAPIRTPGDTDAPASGLTGPLFGTTSDLLRAFILQEVLGPPLSQRKRNSDHRR